jgi:putative lipoic acid-binding regulatory protein
MNEKENKLEYPRVWEFCVFGKDKDKMKQAVEECIPNKISHEDSKSHKSYHSQKVKVNVSSEDERNELYKRLQDHPEIKYIL